MQRLRETLMCAPLTPEMIQAGKDFIRELDRHKFPAKTALWLYAEERGRWRLFIATPQRRSMGPLKSYKAVQRVLSKINSPIDLSSGSLVDTKDRMIKGLSTPFPSRAAARGVRLCTPSSLVESSTTRTSIESRRNLHRSQEFTSPTVTNPPVDATQSSLCWKSGSVGIENWWTGKFRAFLEQSSSRHCAPA